MPIVNPRTRPRDRVGQMRERCTIERPLELQDNDYGQAPQQWERYGRWSCMVETMSGSEAEDARKLYAESTHRLTGRWVADISTQHRVVVRGKVFQIGHVTNIDNRNHDMILLCSAATQ